MHRANRPRWALAIILALASAAQAQSLQVLHWWKSTSERLATNIVADQVRIAHIGWVDEDAGDGIGAVIILRSRILAKDVPDIAQANSMAARNWSKLGLVLDLDSVAAADNWQAQLLPAVERMIRPAGHVVAAPLGIHRLNTLFYNRRQFARLGLAPPQSWDDFERVAARLQRAGVVPLAQSSAPWQVAILFESVLLAEGGAGLHRRLFEQADDAAFADERVAATLRRLRRLKKWMRQPVPEAGWLQMTHELADGRAAMLIAGDWVKGELNAAGMATDHIFGCVASPGTAGMHLYDLDTLTMLRSRQAPRAAQEKVAQIVMAPDLQERYNRVKGSVSVLRNANPAAMDSCARASWTLLANPDAVLVPSVAIGMTGEEGIRDGMVAELHRFFMDDAIPAQDTQRRLASISRAYNRTRLP